MGCFFRREWLDQASLFLTIATMGVMAVVAVVEPALPYLHLGDLLSHEELRDPSAVERGLEVLKRQGRTRWVHWLCLLLNLIALHGVVLGVRGPRRPAR